MEHKKYNQVPFDLDIIDIIEQKVKSLAEEHWKDDECPPEFWVSLNNEDMNNQCIMLTIKHGYKFTEKIFPRKNISMGKR